MRNGPTSWERDKNDFFLFLAGIFRQVACLVKRVVDAAIQLPHFSRFPIPAGRTAK